MSYNEAVIEYRKDEYRGSREQQIRELISDLTGWPVGNIEPQKELFNDLGFDVLDLFDIIEGIERLFGFKFTPTEEGNITTVKDFFDIVESKTNSYGNEILSYGKRKHS